MKIGVFGTGMVGNAIGTKLTALGHEVMMGSRTANNPKAVEWAGQAGAKASAGTFADAAAFGEVLFNCTSGLASVDVLKLAGTANLNGKVLIDVANPLDFTSGMPPSLGIVNTDSLGETIQRLYPQVKVVKTLNTMNCFLMVNPALVPGDHSVFLSGNNKEAKETAKSLLESFGWKSKNIIDLGDISTARATEQMLPVWLRLYGAFQSPMFNFNVVRAEAQAAS